MPPRDIRVAAQLPSTQNEEAHSVGLVQEDPMGLWAVVVVAEQVPPKQLLDMHWVLTRHVSPVPSRVTHWFPLGVVVQYWVIVLQPSVEKGVEHWLETQR